MALANVLSWVSQLAYIGKGSNEKKCASVTIFFTLVLIAVLTPGPSASTPIFRGQTPCTSTYDDLTFLTANTKPCFTEELPC